MNNKNKTVIRCFLTGCKYNSACCTDPYDYLNREFYCTKSNITIDLDEEDPTSGFECQDFTSGYKPYRCHKCKLAANEGDILEEDVFEVEMIEEDDDDVLY